jgi:hypothetical protein
MEGGRSAWLKAVMAAKKPGMSLGDAMKAAKKTYKKGEKFRIKIFHTFVWTDNLD